MTDSSRQLVALIPARAGSKRVVDKNVRLLAGHPLIAYTIAAAKESSIFDDIVVSTDSEPIARIARHYGAEVPFLRSEAAASDASPDIEWLTEALTRLGAAGRSWSHFALLRPTSPFRTAETLRRAWCEFSTQVDVDSLRAVEKTPVHPGKMWLLDGLRMRPAFTTIGEHASPADQPWHSTPYQELPAVYAQNASLEIARSAVVFETATIAGDTLMPFLTEGYEGFDINSQLDWSLAEELARSGAATLPAIDLPAWHDQGDAGDRP